MANVKVNRVQTSIISFFDKNPGSGVNSLDVIIISHGGDMKYWPLFLVLPTLAFAKYKPTPKESCSSIDLRNEILGDVRNQKEVAWCYAFTAADMLGYTYGDRSEKISAADVAIAYNSTKLGKISRWLSVNIVKRRDEENLLMPHQTGFNKIALKTYMKEGSCPESIFPSEAWTRVDLLENSEKEVPLDVGMMEIAQLHKKKNQVTLENLPFYYRFKNVDAAVFVKLLKSKNMTTFYNSLRKTACRDDRTPFDYSLKAKMVLRNSKIFRRISEQLEEGNIVGLDYDSRVLANQDNRRFSLSELHTSTLVGRRWNETSKSCEYLIRNSYGESCGERYDPAYECDQGHIWMSEKLMYPNMTSIVYMPGSN